MSAHSPQYPQVDHEKGIPVKLTEQPANPASTPKVGRFATLGALLLHLRGRGGHSHRYALAVLSLFAAMLGAQLLPSAALAANGYGTTRSFGSATSTVEDSEPLSAPTGIAWSEKTDEIYVIDAGHDRIERFNSTGDYVGQFNGSNVPKTGAFSTPTAIAVDNDLSSPSYGDVYVADAGHNVIDKFGPAGEYIYQLTGTAERSFSEPAGVAVDPSGNLFVYDNRENSSSQSSIYKFDDAVSNAAVLRQNFNAVIAPGIAVDSNDDLYITIESSVAPLLFSIKLPLGGPEPEPEFFTGYPGCECGTGVAVSPTTNIVYLDQGTSVAEYGPFGVPYGSPVDEFGSGSLSGGSGVAVTTTGVVYLADEKADDVEVYEEGPKPEPPVSGSVTVEGLSATVKGELRGGESGYHFAYNTNGACTGAGTNATPLLAASGNESVAGRITGLIAKTQYAFCVVADGTYGHEYGSPVVFETKASPPVVERTNSSVEKKIGATLDASVNPELEPSTCVFQYGKSENYEHETPCEALEHEHGELGEGSTPVPVTASLAGLEPNTIYDYRVLATNGTGKQAGPNETFTTEVITPTQVETGSATDVTVTSAMIGGHVNPQGGATYYVEYGSPTCSLNGIPNFAWWLCASRSSEAGPLTGDTPQTVAPIEITGLAPGTIYSYWIVAHNKNGSERGEEATFTTPPATAATVVSSAPSATQPAPTISAPVPVKPLAKKKTPAEEKAEKLTKALKQCKKDKSNAKRKSCEGQARKRYGTRTRSKPQSHKRGK